MRVSSLLALPLFLAVSASWIGTAAADPCGMVPPTWEGQGPAITRTGEQMTYVFYKDGIESFVIRPSFSGKVDEFGMLIPFPSAPALRKVEGSIFDQIGEAIDPPEVVVDLTPGEVTKDSAAGSAAPGDEVRGLPFSRRVRVIREQAVGIYEVAVLEASGASALQRWLDDHGYRYPDGMGDVVADYVTLGWCFVAVKTRVGARGGVTPRPGMTEADPQLPEGAVFDGNVQAMGFRFKTDELVVPMRLSAFNAGELHNVIYLLTDGPKRPRGIDSALVRRQVSGSVLYANLTEPLPLRVIGGAASEIPAARRSRLKTARDPAPHSGFARDLFAGDLLAARLGRLYLPLEAKEKELLEIDERLGLRGEEIDAVRREILQRAREVAVDEALSDLEGMTLTVIDGDFPREQLAREDITFEEFAMPGLENSPLRYDAKEKAPAPVREGQVYGGHTEGYVPPGKWRSIALVLVLALVCAGLARRAS